MSTGQRLAYALATIAALLGSSCGVSDPSTNTVETLTGTLTVGGFNSHEFRSGGTGEFEVTVTELRPDSNVFIGTQFGQILSGQCTAQVSNIFSVVGRLALNGPISSGRYCVGIFDVGGLRETSTYTIRLSRP
jgi:hypothetical protein